MNLDRFIFHFSLIDVCIGFLIINEVQRSRKLQGIYYFLNLIEENGVN